MSFTKCLACLCGVVGAFLMLGCVTPQNSTVSSGSPVSSGSSISLHSPELAGRWTAQTEENGIRYVDPASRLNDMFIRRVSGPGPSMSEPPLVKTIGEGDPDQKKPYKQKWRHTVIAGQAVRWYQNDEGSGADFPMFKTENFAVTTPQGKTEYYQILVSNGMQGNYISKIDQMLRSVQLR